MNERGPIPDRDGEILLSGTEEQAERLARALERAIGFLCHAAPRADAETALAELTGLLAEGFDPDRCRVMSAYLLLNGELPAELRGGAPRPGGLAAGAGLPDAATLDRATALLDAVTDPAYTEIAEGLRVFAGHTALFARHRDGAEIGADELTGVVSWAEDLLCQALEGDGDGDGDTVAAVGSFRILLEAVRDRLARPDDVPR
ncbi:hypothetical protein, partial [Actinocorallia lasiicapitis]